MGQFYYSEKKRDKNDIKVEKGVSVEYAYDYCSKQNFGVKSACVSKVSVLNPHACKNDKWKREHRAMRNLRIDNYKCFA